MNHRISSKDCSLDQLAAYSPWPARLLGLVPWEPKTKTPAEITREFEDEKWGPLWRRVQNEERQIDVSTLYSWFEDSAHVELCSRGSEFVALTNAQANEAWLELVAENIAAYLPAPALVELGCGFGNLLLSLARRFGRDAGQTMGGEYTKSGTELLNYLARQESLNVQAGTCDFNLPGITSLSIPPDAVIYTSYAVHYVRYLTGRFVEDLCAFRPRIVVHFEPCYEHTCMDSLIGLMRRRYIEVNDYNRNLVTVLEAAQNEGRIEIVSQSPNLFGSNPLLPASLIAWKPITKAAKH